MRALVAGIVLSAAAGVLAACAAGKSPMAPASSAEPAAAAPPEAGVLPPAPRQEIERLANEIDATLRQAGYDVMPPASCAADNSCKATPLSTAPIATDPTCKPGATEQCTQACTIATSICDNAGRICKIASEDLAGADAYANETCTSATYSCTDARAICCSCT